MKKTRGMHFLLHDIVQVATLEWRENWKSMEKAFCSTSIQNERIRALQSSSVISHSYHKLPLQHWHLGGACAYSWRYQLPLPLQVAFSDVSWKGRGGTFPNLSWRWLYETTSHWTELYFESYYLMGLLLHWCFSFLILGKKPIFGDVFFSGVSVLDTDACEDETCSVRLIQRQAAGWSRKLSRKTLGKLSRKQLWRIPGRKEGIQFFKYNGREAGSESCGCKVKKC